MQNFSDDAPFRHRSLLGVFLLLLLASRGAVFADGESWEVRISTNNDLLVKNEIQDDFFTFGGTLEVTYAGLTYTFQENAFTDRISNLRYDESFFTVGGLLPPEWFGGWCVWLEGGANHLGEGLLGQDFQNDVHDLIGDEPVILPYLDVDEVNAYVYAEVGKQWFVGGDDFTLGPQFSASHAASYRTNLDAGVRGIWRPSESFGLDVFLGGRYADTELAALEPHLEETGLAAQVRFDLPWGFFAKWTSNRYGTNRRHFTIGFSIGPGGSAKRHGAWVQAGGAP